MTLSELRERRRRAEIKAIVMQACARAAEYVAGNSRVDLEEICAEAADALTRTMEHAL